MKQRTLPKGKVWKQIVKEEFGPCLVSAKFGLERETLRVTHTGSLSRTPHPKALGSSLTHPLIKTDFAEPQVEFATNTFRSIADCTRELKDLHTFSALRTPDELFWPFSMPAKLPEENKIPLGQYGTSHEGRKKTIYRRGLSNRYGSKMQTISGVHFNFSFDNCLLSLVSEIRYKKPLDYKLKSQIYLDTIRNFNRISPTLLYLFGSSNAFDVSFLSSRNQPWKGSKSDLPKTQLFPYATSLRLSDIGYTSKVQSKIPFSLNSLEEYSKGMCFAVSKTYPGYRIFSEKKENQLNDFYLQLENEYYSLVRPKQIPKDEERVLDALMQRGIEYIEIRLLDNAPFSHIGVEKDTLYFLHLVMLYCLLSESPMMNATEKKSWSKNQERTSWFGRKPGFSFEFFGKSENIRDFLFHFLLELQPIMDLVEGYTSEPNAYFESWEVQWNKWNDSSILPSSIIDLDLKLHKSSFLNYGMNLAKYHKMELLSYKLEKSRLQELTNLSESSLFEQKRIENREGSHLSKNRKPVVIKPLQICR